MDETRVGECAETPEPEPHFEEIARQLFLLDPAGHCRVLGIPVTGQPQVLPEPLPSITLPGDILLVRVAPGRLAHIIYVLDRPDDLEARLLLYHSMIHRAYPKDEISQHVLVMRGDDDG